MASSSLVFDATEADFETTVLARSHEVPVLVDFWASWCGPCRVLGPVVEAEVEARGGDVVLAKVDTEANQRIAARYRISSIPNCKLFIDGQVADEFVGALPASQVRAFLDKNVPSETDRLVAEAATLAAAGDGDGARARLTRAIELEPGHGGARLALARAALAAGDADAAVDHANAISAAAAEADAAAHVRAAAEFARGCSAAGGLDAARARAEAAPDDLDARLALGACLTAAGEYREALDVYLGAVERDKRYLDGAARKAMLTIFGVIGVRSELANEYRGKLSILL